MTVYVIRRLLQAMLTLILVSLVVFVIVRMTPKDRAQSVSLGWIGRRTNRTASWPLVDRDAICRRLPSISALRDVTEMPALGCAHGFGDADFPPTADGDIPGIHLRWYDQRLKGLNTGIDDEPPITLYVMGANEWRHEHEWPLARTRFTDVYLHSDGRANSRFGSGTLSTTPPGNEPPDRFTYDPADPVPTLGGQSMFIVYTTPPLAHDLEVTGPVKLILYATTDAPDTDFTATLVDVHPHGKALHLCEGIVRARFRNSLV